MSKTDYLYSLPNVDWYNNNLFYIYEYWEETSWLDDRSEKRWNGVCYEILVKVRIPRVFEHCEQSRDMWIQWMYDNYPDHEYFWINEQEKR